MARPRRQEAFVDIAPRPVLSDRALVTSGWWGEQAVDVYRLPAGKSPQFEQTIRTRDWSVNSVSRQDQTLFLSSGYWGVQKIQLQ